MAGLRVLFGKYTGTAVVDLPDDYLRWLHGQPWLRDPLKTAIDREHAARGAGRHRDDAHRSAGDRHAGAAGGRPLLDPHVREAARRIVTAGYRAVARESHPDLGGDLRTMQATNAAAEALRALLTF